MCLITESTKHMPTKSRRSTRIKQTAGEVGLNLNLQKTNTMLITNEDKQEMVQLDWKNLQSPNECRYLGSMLDCKGWCDKDISRIMEENEAVKRTECKNKT